MHCGVNNVTFDYTNVVLFLIYNLVMYLSQNKEPIKEQALLNKTSLDQLTQFASEGQTLEWMSAHFKMHHLAFKRMVYSNQEVASAILKGECDWYEKEKSVFLKAKQYFLELKHIDGPLKPQQMSLVNNDWQNFQKEFSKWSLTSRLAKYDDKMIDQAQTDTGKNLRAVLIDLATKQLKLPPANDLRQRPEYLKISIGPAEEQLKEIENKQSIKNGRDT